MKREFHKSLPVLLISALLIGALPTSAAVPIAGATCSKLGITFISQNKKFTCVKSGKKLVWNKGIAIKPNIKVVPTPVATSAPIATPAPTQAATPTTTPTDKTNYYSAKDQSTVQLLNATESCSNPNNASFEIQALAGGEWLPIKVIESGWQVSTKLCSNPLLGARNSLAWAKVYIDPETKYRWIFSGEINMPLESRDSKGRGISQVNVVPSITKPFKAVNPISLPVILNKKITFANAVTDFRQIPQIAWQNVQNEISENAPVEIPTTIVIGPNTDTTVEQILTALKKEYRLWSGFQQPPSFAGLVYNAKDEAWAEIEWPKLAARLNLTDSPNNYIPNHLRAGCNFSNGVAKECYGGMALVFPNTTAGFAFYGVQSPYWSTSSFQSGAFSQVTHEYTHNVQYAQWIGSQLRPGEYQRSDSAHNGSPCWFSEGQANAIGITVASNDLNSYMVGRDNSIRRSINQNTPVKPVLSNTTLTAEALTSFLFNQDIASCYNPQTNGDWQLGYNIGYAATEVLVAIGGPRSTMALLTQTASGLTWSEAFQAVYGISWKEGAAILGRVLEAEYLDKPMDH